MEEKKHKQLRKRIIRFSFIAMTGFAIALSLVVTGTRPDSVGLLGIIGFFVLLYGGFISLFVLIYSLRAHRSPIRFRAMLIAAILALGPVMLLAMSSTSSLNLLDVGLVILFEIAAIFYVSRVA